MGANVLCSDDRVERGGVPVAVLCEGLCGQSAGVFVVRMDWSRDDGVHGTDLRWVQSCVCTYSIASEVLLPASMPHLHLIVRGGERAADEDNLYTRQRSTCRKDLYLSGPGEEHKRGGEDDTEENEKDQSIVRRVDEIERDDRRRGQGRGDHRREEVDRSFCDSTAAIAPVCFVGFPDECQQNDFSWERDS